MLISFWLSRANPAASGEYDRSRLSNVFGGDKRDESKLDLPVAERLVETELIDDLVEVWPDRDSERDGSRYTDAGKMSGCSS